MTDQATITDVERLADLNATIRELTAEADSIKARLRATFAEKLGSHDVGAYRINVAASRRWNEAQALAVLPPEIVAACQVATLSSAEVKKLVSPAMYEACTVPSEPRVSIL